MILSECVRRGASIPKLIVNHLKIPLFYCRIWNYCQKLIWVNWQHFRKMYRINAYNTGRGRALETLQIINRWTYDNVHVFLVLPLNYPQIRRKRNTLFFKRYNKIIRRFKEEVFGFRIVQRPTTTRQRIIFLTYQLVRFSVSLEIANTLKKLEWEIVKKKKVIDTVFCWHILS